MKHKAYLTGTLVIKSISLAVCIFCWIGGLSAFLEKGGIPGWILWSAICTITMPFDLLKLLVGSVRDGAKDGSNQYVVKDYGSFRTTSNQTFKGAIMGFFGGILGYLVVGPILTLIKSVGHIVAIFTCVKYLRIINQNESEN